MLGQSSNEQTMFRHSAIHMQMTMHTNHNKCSLSWIPIRRKIVRATFLLFKLNSLPCTSFHTEARKTKGKKRGKSIFTWCIYGGGPAVFVRIGLFAEIPRLKFFVKIYFRLYERRASPPWRDLAVVYPRSRLGELHIFHINALKRAGPPPRRASNLVASTSNLRTHDKVSPGQYFLG